MLRLSLLKAQEERKRTFVTADEFEELKVKVNRLEQTLEKIRPSSTEDLDQAVHIATSELCKMKAIKKMENLSEKGILRFYVSIPTFSSQLSKKIAHLEIELSKNSPKLAVEIRPVLFTPDEKKIKSCH